jgi:membrane protease YdiL (CAAX protease family)
MTSKNKIKKQIALFIGICFISTFSIDFIIHAKGGLEKANLVPLQMLMPVFAAIAALLITRQKPVFKNLGFKIPKPKYWLTGTVLILICVLLSYCISAFFIPDLFINAKQINEHILKSGLPAKTENISLNIFTLFALNILVVPIVSLPIFLGEEAGWRAFMMPRLLQITRKYAFIIGGVIWSLWHWPIIAMGHNYPGYPISGNLLFILFCIPTGYILYFFYKKSGSVFVPALMHGVLNKATMTMLVYCVDERKIQPLFFCAAGVTGIAVFSIAALILYTIDKKQSQSRPLVWQ